MGREFLRNRRSDRSGIVVLPWRSVQHHHDHAQRRKTVVSLVLLIGLVGRCSSCSRSTTRTTWSFSTKYFWWWVVHLWVEGVGTDPRLDPCLRADQDHGVDREVIEKWLYVIIAMT